ncbi:MAG TPA: FAD/NAD(P)-binding oxidoreductase, partial [Anaerolinea sp.]|nr:FAD/NAD(P)-binding oxidoreductase [Anaerolinea sp.]
MSAYVFIGAGVAALAAAEAVRGLDPSASITLLSDDPHGYYSRPGLAYYLAGELDERILFPFQPHELKQRGFTLEKARVTRILPAEKVVELDGARRIPYDRLLIATGARAVPLDTPGAQLEGVHKLDSLEDARRLVGRSRGAHHAVVVGGGITALELAEGLAARHVKVHYLLRGERYWPNVLDEVESGIIERRL